MTHPIGTTQADHGTICGRSCANSGHYKPLCAYVDRTFVNSKFVAPASRKNSFPPAGTIEERCSWPSCLRRHGQRQELTLPREAVRTGGDRGEQRPSLLVAEAI